eukprot:TRINITY_DN65975_c0_g1_i2.p3 TRINITY_DN65975_c0_g1~~TRINITY_DN65975_c0_g1_i2.p3  ORF type:complete len:354 (+),score=35.44 TRINITY_DN65975_c0_g1_i2:99-1160(+)
MNPNLRHHRHPATTLNTNTSSSSTTTGSSGSVRGTLLKLLVAAVILSTLVVAVSGASMLSALVEEPNKQFLTTTPTRHHTVAATPREDEILPTEHHNRSAPSTVDNAQVPVGSAFVGPHTCASLRLRVQQEGTHQLRGVSSPLAAHTGLFIGCLGDSITEGVHHKGKRKKGTTFHPFPHYLQQYLEAKLKYVKVVGYGHSGATLMNKTKLPYTSTKHWLAIKRDSPDIVVLLLGTNDSKKKHWLKAGGAVQFAVELQWMVKTLQELPSQPLVILGHPPPVFKSIDTIDNRTLVEQIYKQQKRVAAQLELPTFSLYQPLNSRGLMHDGVHPNDKGRHVIAEVVGEVLLQCLGRT